MCLYKVSMSLNITMKAILVEVRNKKVIEHFMKDSRSEVKDSLEQIFQYAN